MQARNEARDETREGRGGARIRSRGSSDNEKAPERTLSRNFRTTGEQSIIKGKVREMKIKGVEIKIRKVRPEVRGRAIERTKMTDHAQMLHLREEALFKAMRDLTGKKDIEMDQGTVDVWGTALVSYVKKYPEEYLARTRTAEKGGKYFPFLDDFAFRNYATPVVVVEGKTHAVTYAALLDLAMDEAKRNERKAKAQARKQAKG